MASLALGANKLAPTVIAMPGLGKMAAKLGFASLYLDPAEADQLAVELQSAAQ
ncbi:hypothetical protein [Stenotrophomonas sp.]|jgi:hypothetical protein|uniref:hypothetical protein n=1 Tax=Stenotrophomonas sp. TaxID=69392 RepID=UPI003341158C